MIYLTAHRVVSKKGSGINCYLYERAAPLPGPDELRDVNAREPGELVSYKDELPPGGNSIVSFLDIFAENPPDMAAVDQVLASAAESLRHHEDPPLLIRNPRAALRFNTNIGLYARASAELAELAERALHLLMEPPERRWSDKPPLLVKVEFDEERTTFSLDDTSIQRVSGLRGEEWTPSHVSISHYVRDDFERMVGSLIPMLAKLITRLDDQGLIEMGGVRYIDAQTGEALGEWPPRSRR